MAALPLMPVIGVVAVVALVLGLLGVGSGASSNGPRPQALAVRVSSAAPKRAIASGFLGLSFEYSAVESYAGSDPAAVNPVFEQLIRNLVPGQRPVLRIGGDSADWSWWPVPGMLRPPGVTYTLSTGWLQVTRALVRALNARVIPGLNFEAGDPQLAAAEAQALVGGIGSGSIVAFELGNEPPLYGTFAWYRTPDGRPVTGRAHGYDFAAFQQDFTRFSDALPHLALAGPTTGGPAWIPHLGAFLAAAPQVAIVTVHHYPLQLCFARRGAPNYPTVRHLLSAAASTGLADSFAPALALARARGLPLRIDELNTVSCGADARVSQTFAAALWALDTLFELARVGVNGVNIHTFPGAGYELFRFERRGRRWRAAVAPEYYGLWMFAQAAPPGSRLLSVSGATNALKVWATTAPDRRIRVVLINKAAGRVRVVALRVPGAAGAATLERLRAPSVTARSGVTLGGRSLGSATATGRLPQAPATIAVTPTHGGYVVEVPAASAALLTLRVSATPARHLPRVKSS